ncbi:hypothetical protein IHE55_24570 [Streptomyces pactum]|uniref:Uncharacterized protein n=1 Tax=Streptomyces pactum TaxID=68249 RepID=A0ABS0NRF9_9ACTN|nr:hypothetical protein [Streptomyces pactum]MBH5337776.1 hypothetical protein [Streptomyces pactum]
MPVLIRRQRVDVPVEFFVFSLQDADDTEVPVPFPDGWPGTEAGFLVQFEGRVDVSSAGHTHVALLTAEVWDSEPPEERREPWETCGDTRIRSGSGSLAVWVPGGATTDELTLGVPGDLWHLRVYCTGRTEVARAAARGVPHGIERYLAQFWPAVV